MTPIYSNTVMIRISSFDFPLDSFTQFGAGIGPDKTFQGMPRVQYMLDVITLVCMCVREKEIEKLCVREKETEKHVQCMLDVIALVCVCVCVCVCVHARMCVCVCVFV